MELLSRSEEIVLMAIWKLQSNAYGVTIRERVSEITEKEWSIGAIYAPLHRLGKNGYVTTLKGDPVAERGGRSKVFYTLTGQGKEALVRIRSVHEAMWADAPALSAKNS